MVSESLQSVLRGSREALNARFAEARQRFPALSPDAFAEFLRDVVDPLASAVAVATPDRCEAVVLAAYDIALDLVGQRLVGPGARGTGIDAVWRGLLPAIPRHLAEKPARVLASLSNAAHQVEATPSANVSMWLSGMTHLAPA